MRGIRFEASYPGMVDTPFTRVVRFTDNHIRVLAEPEEGFLSAGIMMGTDNGANVYDGQIFVKGNEIEILRGDAALVFGYNRGPDWVSVLNGAVIQNNHIRGTARYGMLSVDGAQYCNIFGNELDTFEPSIAHIGFYGLATNNNTVRGYSGVVIVADGAYNNHITGFTPMSPHAVPRTCQRLVAPYPSNRWPAGKDDETGLERDRTFSPGPVSSCTSEAPRPGFRFNTVPTTVCP